MAKRIHEEFPPALEKLTDLRNAANKMTQKDAADFLGVRRATYNQWENGVRIPSEDHRDRMISLLVDKYRLVADIKQFDDFWNELCVGVWEWKELSDAELRECFPGSAEEYLLEKYGDRELFGGRNLFSSTIVAQSDKDLVGHGELLDDLTRRITEGERFFELTGVGGIGKTMLANTLVRRYEIRKYFGDRVLWTNLGPNPNLRMILNNFAELLGVTRDEMTLRMDIDGMNLRLQQAIGGHRLLFVLDDVWELEHARAFRLGGGNCYYIITTRKSSIGGRRFRTIEVPFLSTEEGLQLLQQYAPRTVRDAPELARELVESADGLPLAIHCPGKKLERLEKNDVSPEGRRQKLQEMVEDKERQLSAAAPRHPRVWPEEETPFTVLDSIARSDKKLDEDSRQTLRALAMFPLPCNFSGPAILEVSAQAPSALYPLLEFGLIRRMQGVPYKNRYTVKHSSIFEYAKIQLNEEEDLQQSFTERLVGYYKKKLADYHRDLSWVAIEQNNIAAACDYVCAEDAARITLAIKQSLCELASYDLLASLVDKPRFEQATSKIIREEVTDPIAVFLGAGDLGRGIIRQLQQRGVTCIAIDGKISLGWIEADYQFLHNQEGKRMKDTEWLLGLLRDLAPHSVSSEPDSSKPILIGEYHGFDAPTIFREAERLGYRVFPSTQAAIVAMDKIEALKHFKNIPGVAEHLLPQRTFPPIPEEITRLQEDQFSSETKQFMKKLHDAVNEIGLPCVFKPAISEFGYAQSIVYSKQDVLPALKAMAEEGRVKRVNPNKRFVVQKYIHKPTEVVQIIVRHRDHNGDPHSTCQPPVWNTVVFNEETFGGPFVFEYVYQLEDNLPSEIQDNREEIEALSKRIVESFGNDVWGVYGVELFVKNGRVWFNRLSIRTQDTMMVTTLTSEYDCFRLVAETALGANMDPQDISKLQRPGAMCAILWKGGDDRLSDFAGIEEAKALEQQYGVSIKVDTYDPKVRLRPLRRMGTISLISSKEMGRDEIHSLLKEAREEIQIKGRKRDNAGTEA